ncbi:regulatory protein, luxR family [Bradyrhizobium shewense]|uniref:Regulatory protein, luxR family n=1 Tax=Bradyrhizobium shewense TaxID=1761772 RepID=A0A1C3WIX1_9BRAD|nr:regulatory protein, luxR family [Bradyrhizobium shewense]
MSEDRTPEIVLALEIDDPALADRLAALLGSVAGLRLAGPGEAAAATVVARDPRIMPADIALTQRELDVLALMAEGASNKMIARRLGISVHTPSNSMSARCSTSWMPPAAPMRWRMRRAAA